MKLLIEFGIIFLFTFNKEVLALQTEAAKKLSNQARSDGYLLSMFEVVLATMESKLRRVENLDRAVQQLMMKMDTMERRTNGQSDTILSKLDTLSKSVEHWDESVRTRLEKLDNLCSEPSARGQRRDDEEDLVAEPSERHARFWNPATQIAQNAQNSHLARGSIQNVTEQIETVPIQANAAAGFRRRRLIRKSGHLSSAEVLSENLSPALVVSTSNDSISHSISSNSNNNNIINMDEVKEAVKGMDRRLGSSINLVAENLSKVVQMLEDVHSALIDDVITSGVSGSSNSSTASTARAVTSSTPSTTTTHKKTKLDLLLTQLSPLFGIKEKMEQVKEMVNVTKTSLDHLIPKSDEIFNQTRRQEKAISNIQSDLNERTNAIMKELTEVERELARTKQNVGSIYQISGTRKADNIPSEIFEQNIARDFTNPDFEEGLIVVPPPLPSITKITTTSTTTTTTTPASTTTPTIATSKASTFATHFAGAIDNANKMRMRSTAWTTETTSSTTTTTPPPATTLTTKTTMMLVNVSTPTTAKTTTHLVNVTGTVTTATTTTARSVAANITTPIININVNNSIVNSNNNSSNGTDFGLANNNTVNHETVSCANIKKKDPLAESGVFYLEITGNKYRFLKVYCDMEASGGGWTVIQRREDFGEELRENFSRGWDDYKYGFGDPDHEFWMGNENIYMFTRNDDYELRVELDDFDGNRRYAEYKHFKLGSEEEDYRLEIGGYVGNAGDSLNDPWYGSNQRPFSTYDRDNDRSSLNCASMLKGGWWWKSCGRGLNGVYLTNPQDLSARQGIVWFRWRGWDYTLKRSRMMIRPKNFMTEEKEVEK